MDVSSTLIAHSESPEPVQPREGSLHNPPVDAQPLLRFDTSPGNTMLHPALAAGVPASSKVIPLVCMQFLGSLTGSPTAPIPHSRNRVDQGLEHLGVVLVCWSHLCR